LRRLLGMNIQGLDSLPSHVQEAARVNTPIRPNSAAAKQVVRSIAAALMVNRKLLAAHVVRILLGGAFRPFYELTGAQSVVEDHFLGNLSIRASPDSIVREHIFLSGFSISMQKTKYGTCSSGNFSGTVRIHDFVGDRCFHKKSCAPPLFANFINVQNGQVVESALFFST